MNAAARIFSADNVENYGFGPAYKGEGNWQFSLHAPNAGSVRLTFSNDGKNWFSFALQQQADGWFCGFDRRIRPGARYWFVLDDEHGYPDPWSRCQPDGPHQASQLIDENIYSWRDRNWVGRPWHEAVIYELHVGTFTPEGTFLSAIDRLDLLRNLGITALQIMPVWTNPKGIGWGYDSNYLFSVNHAYGSPNDFKALVDAAHSLGMQVLLDVVYNHLGIEGNYLADLDPAMLSCQSESLWGQKLNFDGDGCSIARQMIVANGLYWLENYHLDGLRIDSPISIDDRSSPHILEQLAIAVQSKYYGHRQVHLVLENDHYAGRLMGPDGEKLYCASLNIKGSENLLSAALTINNLDDDDRSQLVDSLAAGSRFDFGDEWQERPGFTQVLQSDQQILCLQNHDLIGNSQQALRIWSGLDQASDEVLLATICLSPATPQFFMGDEFGCEAPFPYFCQFRDVSQDAILGGRKRDFGIDPEQDGFLYPFCAATHLAAKITWPDDGDLVQKLNFVQIKSLLEARRIFIQPLAAQGQVESASQDHGPCHNRIAWRYSHGWILRFEWVRGRNAQLSDRGQIIHQIDGEGWSARWWVEPV